MKKINRCLVCGRLILDKEICSICLDNLKKNDDPFEVTEINIMKMIWAYEKSTSTREKVNMLKEIDFASNRAYMNGYISEDVYQNICTSLGLEPMWDDIKYLPASEHDTSYYAMEGFYYDMVLTTIEE